MQLDSCANKASIILTRLEWIETFSTAQKSDPATRVAEFHYTKWKEPSAWMNKRTALDPLSRVRPALRETRAAGGLFVTRVSFSQ